MSSRFNGTSSRDRDWTTKGYDRRNDDEPVPRSDRGDQKYARDPLRRRSSSPIERKRLHGDDDSGSHRKVGRHEAKRENGMRRDLGGQNMSANAGRSHRHTNDVLDDSKSSGSRDANLPVHDEEEYEMYTEQRDLQRIEERRKQRQAILARHQDNLSSAAIDTRQEANSPATTTTVPSPSRPSSREGSVAADKGKEVEHFQLGKDDKQQMSTASAGPADVSAAEYDPNMDRALDAEREAKLLQVDSQRRGAEEHVSGAAPATNEESDYEEVEVSDDEDIEDIFAITEDVPKKKKTIRVKKGPSKRATPSIAPQADAAPATLLDNWDDPDGYYRITLGETLGQGARYHVFAVLGRGMFSSVVKARDTANGDREVAIKVVRSQETMYKAGLKEIAVLQRLESLDPEDTRHLIRLVAHFEHRKHLCMVFESLSMNLREVVKRFGKNVGLNMQAVRAYAHQMFLGLALMRKAEVMHADLKPDNILVNDSKTVVKICDLGSASNLTEMEITPYLVSRFYRAPEIILGMPYDCAIDMWSIGCTLYELATGKILFPGKSNNHMLRLMQELKGKFTTKQLRKGRFAGLHFDDTNAFVSRDSGGQGSDTLRKVQTFNPAATGTDLRARLLPTNANKALSPSEVRLTTNFIDLLSRSLELDPARRLTPSQALQHPFFNKTS